MYLNYFMRLAWNIMCTLSIVTDSEAFKPNNELHRDKNEGMVATNNQDLHDSIQFVDESLNYILPRLNNTSDYGKNQMEIKTPFLRRLEIDERNGIQHLCMSPEKRIMAKHYMCRSKDFKSFACVGEGGKLGSCNKHFINKQLNEPLCIKKNQFSFVVPCNNPWIKGYCFLSESRKDVLIPCDGGNLKVCYRDHDLSYCTAIRKKKIRSRKRRSMKNEILDPRNIQCSDCEVDILMEVYEGSTPMIEVKISPLNGNIPSSKDSNGIEEKLTPDLK